MSIVTVDNENYALGTLQRVNKSPKITKKLEPSTYYELEIFEKATPNKTLMLNKTLLKLKDNSHGYSCRV